jgi:hypothetical protein
MTTRIVVVAWLVMLSYLGFSWWREYAIQKNYETCLRNALVGTSEMWREQFEKELAKHCWDWAHDIVPEEVW